MTKSGLEPPAILSLFNKKSPQNFVIPDLLYQQHLSALLFSLLRSRQQLRK
jgi:hypothetical protein